MRTVTERAAARILADVRLVARDLPRALAAMRAEADPSRCAVWDEGRGTTRHDADGTPVTGPPDPVGEFVVANRGLWAEWQLLCRTRRACRAVHAGGPVDTADVVPSLRRLVRALPHRLDNLPAVARATGAVVDLVAEWAGSTPDARTAAAVEKANDDNRCWWHLTVGVKAPKHRRHSMPDGGSRPACQWRLRRLTAGHTPTRAELELHAQGRRVPMPEAA